MATISIRTIEVPYDDLPDSAVVRGTATMYGGFDARGEENSPEVVERFNNERWGSVKNKLAQYPYCKIVITSLFIPSA